jgi:Holliday junction resolvasome RuvABC DNA-binding subunit
MKPSAKTCATPSNAAIAAVLFEISTHLQHIGDSPFRVAAYRRAGAKLSSLRVPVSQIYAEEGEDGLRRIPGIGKSLARTVKRLLVEGDCKKLDRLRQRDQGLSLLRTLPGVGQKIANCLQVKLPGGSLEAVFAAACDGRLRRIPGIGLKRARAIRECLASRLQAGDATGAMPLTNTAVSELLSIDSEYREKAGRGRLPLAAPKLFNPGGSLWLPILRTERSGLQFSAHYANTARSHLTDSFRDWVVITCDNKDSFGQWTVLTATRGDLRDRRVVLHREAECRRHYKDLFVQKPLKLDGSSPHAETGATPPSSQTT